MLKLVLRRAPDALAAHRRASRTMKLISLLQERARKGLTPREGGKVLHCDGMELTNIIKNLGDAVVTYGWSPVNNDPSCIQEARYYLREFAPGGKHETETDPNRPDTQP